MKAIIKEFNQKLQLHIDDIQSYFLICDYIDTHLEHADALMSVLFMTAAHPPARCNLLICIDWLLFRAPHTIDIVNREIVVFAKALLQDHKDAPGALYTGTIMKLLPNWSHLLDPQVNTDLHQLVHAKVSSQATIPLKYLTTVLDQDRERFKKLKEKTHFEPLETELDVLHRYVTTG